MKWVKTDTGFTDVDQAVSLKKIVSHEEKMFVWSNLLYYNEHSPVLDDATYDACEQFLEKYYHETSDSFKARFSKGNLKTEAHTTKALEGEMEAALEWSKKWNKKK